MPPSAHATFDLLPPDLARDVELSLSLALHHSVRFPAGDSPLAVFRHALATSIWDIQTHPRGQLLQRFLTLGPYPDGGDIPPDFTGCISDQETADAIAFIYGHVVQSFQGALAELLAAAPCLRVLHRLQEAGSLPPDARLHAGDSVTAGVAGLRGTFKAADFHVLIEDQGAGRVTVAAVAEVKSYRRRSLPLAAQLERHRTRLRSRLTVDGRTYESHQVRVGVEDQGLLTIRVVPSRWPLPRSFTLDEVDGRTFVNVDSPIPPDEVDRIEHFDAGRWQVTLRWSHEALAAAALEVSFWYMEKFGEVLYAGGVPPEWAGMTPAEAGQNAAEMMLGYAILRARTRREDSRAVALYNSYGFGPALGMNFRDAKGRREMLWPADLRELLATGRTQRGCRITTPRQHVSASSPSP